LCRDAVHLIRECMSSNPLPLPEIWSDLPKGDAPEHARSGLPSGRSGLVLVDYAGGNAQSDSSPVVRPLDRAGEAPEAGVPVPVLASAVLAKGLSDLTAIVTQAEALLWARGTMKGDVYFAVERIHDVALALRMRDVNAALCDTLEASVREVGDAVIRHEAAATGALSAAALLGDIMHRLEELIRIAAGAEPVAGPPTTEAAPAPPASATNVFVATLTSVAFEAQTVDDIPLPFARTAAQSLEAPALAEVSQAQATNDPQPAAAADASADSAAQPSSEVVAGPLAYSSPVPMADQPVTAAVEALVADEVLAESAVSTGAMSGRTISEEVLSEGATSEGEVATVGGAVSAAVVSVVSENVRSEVGAPEDVTLDATSADAGEARAFLDALSDELPVGNEALREPQPAAEEDDPRPDPVEHPAAAAVQLQNEINVPAEIVAVQSVPAEVVAVESTAAEAAAEVVAAEMIPAEIVTSETAATESDAPELVAARPADDQDQPIAAPVGENEPNQLPSSPVIGKGATAAETVIRRPASDPLAAFYGLSEEELIALFS
jgi:hypothetical protein